MHFKITHSVSFSTFRTILTNLDYFCLFHFCVTNSTVAGKRCWTDAQLDEPLLHLLRLLTSAPTRPPLHGCKVCCNHCSSSSLAACCVIHLLFNTLIAKPHHIRLCVCVCECVVKTSSAPSLPLPCYLISFVDSESLFAS